MAWALVCSTLVTCASAAFASAVVVKRREVRLVMVRYLGVVLATIFVINAALLWRSTVEDCTSECGTPSFGFLAGTLIMSPFLVIGVGLILWAPRVTR